MVVAGSVYSLVQLPFLSLVLSVSSRYGPFRSQNFPSFFLRFFTTVKFFRKFSARFATNLAVIAGFICAMSDPLSIAVGVVSILTAAAQISSLLINFMRQSSSAPRQAAIVLTEVTETSGVLSNLQSFLLGTEIANQSQTCLLQVDHVLAIVTGCVATFSELEETLGRVKMEGMDILDRIKWARKESGIMAIVQRLQTHKASLSLMLNILNG